MSGKLKAQLFWPPVVIAYLSLPSPFGWYAMLLLVVYNFLVNVVALFIVKTVTPEDKHYEFSAFNECKTNALDWMVYIAAFSACIASRDYALASGIVLVLYAELEIFRITGTVS